VQGDDQRPQIAALSQRAADVLAEDVADPGAFTGHPHPEQAYGFLKTLNDVALWGTNAQVWDDAMLANMVTAADACALGIRIGADAYYEVIKGSFPEGVYPNDPDTCIFAEIQKYEEAIARCALDDALCRMTAFWEFTVLNSCRRCLRA
jgi:hypothetical protein